MPTLNTGTSIFLALLANFMLAFYGPMVKNYGTGAINNATNMFVSYTFMAVIVLIVRTLRSTGSAAAIWKTTISPDMLRSAAINIFRLLLLFMSLNMGNPGVTYACYMTFPIFVLIQQWAGMRGVPPGGASPGTIGGAFTAFAGILIIMFGPMLYNSIKQKFQTSDYEALEDKSSLPMQSLKNALQISLPAVGAAVLMSFMLFFLKKLDLKGTIKTVTNDRLISPVEEIMGLFVWSMFIMVPVCLLYNKSAYVKGKLDYIKLGGGDDHYGEFWSNNIKMMLFNCLGGFVGYYLLFFALKNLTVLQISIFSNFLPVFGFLIGIVFIHGCYRKEKIPWSKLSIKILGIAVIILGSILVAVYHRKKVLGSVTKAQEGNTAVPKGSTALQGVSNGQVITTVSEFKPRDFFVSL